MLLLWNLLRSSECLPGLHKRNEATATCSLPTDSAPRCAFHLFTRGNYLLTHQATTGTFRQGPMLAPSRDIALIL